MRVRFASPRPIPCPGSHAPMFLFVNSITPLLIKTNAQSIHKCKAMTRNPQKNAKRKCKSVDVKITGLSQLLSVRSFHHQFRHNHSNPRLLLCNNPGHATLHMCVPTPCCWTEPLCSLLFIDHCIWSSVRGRRRVVIPCSAVHRESVERKSSLTIPPTCIPSWQCLRNNSCTRNNRFRGSLSHKTVHRILQTRPLHDRSPC